MKVEFLKQFSKDLDSLKVKHIRQALLQLILSLEQYDSLEQIPHLKKLKGHKNAYRIRVGDYRLGFFYDGSLILLARFVHRKDIYRLFP